jgi:hypothetical protein
VATTATKAAGAGLTAGAPSEGTNP